MELEEFKKYWSEELEKEFQGHQHSPQHINEIIMKTRTTMDKIVKMNKFWLYVCYASVAFMGLATTAGIMEYQYHPEKFSPDFIWYNLFLFVFILITTWLYYVQHKIFDLKSADIDLRSAIEKSIGRFNDFYRLSFGMYAILFPFIFFIVMSTLGNSLLPNLNTGLNILIAIILSGLSLWGNHLYYKKTYFTWINRMKSNLQELNEEE